MNIDEEKIKLCKKIRFIQDSISTDMRIIRYEYPYLLTLNVPKLNLIYDQYATIKKKELKNINNQRILAFIEDILEEIYLIYYTEKSKCFMFYGEYKNTPIVELVKYEDEELWEYMIPKDIEEKFGKYNVYILNVIRFTLYKVCMDGFESIRDMLRNPIAYNRYCDISFTLTVNFFYDILQKKNIQYSHYSFDVMKKDIIEEFNKYIETNGTECYDEYES